MGVIGLAAALLLLISGVGFAADDINVVGGAYTGVLRAPDVGALGKFYQTVTIGDAVTPNQFQKINPQGGAHVNLRDATNAEIGVVAAPLVVKGAGAAAADSIAVRCVNTAGSAFESCASGGADVLGTTSALNATNAEASALIAGQKGIGVHFSDGNMVGTALCEASFDLSAYTHDGSPLTCNFIDPVTGVDLGTSIVFDGTETETSYTIYTLPGVRKVRVRVNPYTSGSTNGTIIATTHAPVALLLGTDGTRPRSVFMTTAVSPGAGDRAIVVTCKNCTGTGGSNFADNAAFTGGTTSVTGFAALFDATPPTITDGNAGIVRMNANRLLMTLLVDANGDSVVDATNDAVFVSNKTVSTDGGQSAAAATTAFTNCVLRDNKNFSSTTRQLLVAATASEIGRICGALVWLNGDAEVTFYDGTQTTNPCDAGTPVAIGGPYYASSTNGRAVVIPASLIPLLKGTAANRQLCVGTSAAVSTTVTYVYASY